MNLLDLKRRASGHFAMGRNSSSPGQDENGGLLPGWAMGPLGYPVDLSLYGGEMPVVGVQQNGRSAGAEILQMRPLASGEYKSVSDTGKRSGGRSGQAILSTSIKKLPTAPKSVIAAGASPAISYGEDGTGGLMGYTKNNPDGSVTTFGLDGTNQGTRIPSRSSGGFFGGLSDAVSGLGKEIAGSPLAQAAISGGLALATGGASIPWTAGAMAANSGTQTSNSLGAGLSAGLLSYGAGAGANALAGASATAAGSAASPYTLAPSGTGFGGAAAGSGLQAGGTIGMGASTVGSGLSSSLAANSLAAGLGTTGLLASDTVAGLGTGTVAGTTAGTTAAGAAGAGKMISTGNATLDAILNGAKDYAPLIGAVGGALTSGDTSSTQTADKSPWGPAQEWMKANLGLGQTMQAKYAANPFNRQQQQAYNNSATGGNQFRTTANSLINQMGQRQSYNRNAPNQVTPYSFGASNLGMTSMPFAGVK